MAKQVITTTEYTDDLDGGSAAETITFSFHGASYEIDLSKANAKAFEKVVKPYVDAARKVRGPRTARTAKASPPKRDLSAIRQWAKSAGYEVSERGRIANAVIEAYEAAE